MPSVPICNEVTYPAAWSSPPGVQPGGAFSGRTVRKCSLARGWWKSVHPGGVAVSEMKTTSLAAFASQLRAWRRQMGWTQVEAADKLGYSARVHHPCKGNRSLRRVGELNTAQTV